MNNRVLHIFITVFTISFFLLITGCDDDDNEPANQTVQDSMNGCDPNSSAYAPASLECNSVSPHCPNDFPFTCGDSTRCFKFETDCKEAGECCPLNSGNNVNSNNWVYK